MFKNLLENHVLATLTFVLVLVMGLLAYFQMPREKNPSFNYNAVAVVVLLPGASTWDIEKALTIPVEQAVAKVDDVRTVTSVSQEGLSTTIVRFGDINDETYDRRITDLRREVQNISSSLPPEASSPTISSVNSSNSFPSVSVIITAVANDENLRKQAEYVSKDLERIKGVESVGAVGLHEPEYQIRFHPEELQGLGISPTSLADTVRSHFRDISAGTIKVNDQQWVVRLVGAVNDLEYLAKLPVLTANGEVPLETVADVVRGRSKATGLARSQGKPAIMINLTKKGSANTLKLLDDVRNYIEQRNALKHSTGIELSLLYDQTASIRNSIAVMESNAFWGLILVMFMTWLFLGWKIALLTTLGIPFTLAGTFWILSMLGFTMNNPVLLAIVISLGMLVDDAVVVVETIYHRLQKGGDAVTEVALALQEVIPPVLSAVLTTIAAFLPLMLLPGVLGKFMLVVPLVVTVALIFSLTESFWMLPSHVQAWDVNFTGESHSQRMREKLTKKLRHLYTKLLFKVMRWQKLSLATAVGLFFLSIYAVSSDIVKVNFFAFDSYRVFYIDIELEPGTSLDQTLDKMLEVENLIRDNAMYDEIRAVASSAGRANGKTGDHLGRILVTLQPPRPDLRKLDEMVEAIRPIITNIPGTYNVNLVTFSDVPQSPAISVKIRGDDFTEINAAAKALHEIVEQMEGSSDVKIEDNTGSMQLSFQLDVDAVRRAGLNPEMVSRTIRLMVDGEVLTSVQDQGEQVDIRLLSSRGVWNNIDEFMRQTIALPNGGGDIPLAQLLSYKVERGTGKIRHYQFRRSITLEADIDKSIMNTVQANQYVKEEWEKIQIDYPNVNLDFSGELDDIQESLDALVSLFLFGILLIFLILGTQFNSFSQPLMILFTVPMAFMGVVLGLFVTNNPLSLFTMFGVVALAGIAVNDDIVLISTANDSRKRGVSKLYAAIYAGRRRFVPVIITSLTTIAGLFTLATGLAGFSLMWGPVAVAIVWGLASSTVLTLFILPVIYYNFSKETIVQRDCLPRRLFLRLTPLLSFVSFLLPKGSLASRQVDQVESAMMAQSKGAKLMKEGKYWEAILHFEEEANADPENKTLNLNTAQAMLIFMQKFGADVGFLKRSKRYLDRVAQQDSGDKRYRRLLKLYQQLVITGGDSPNLE